MGGITLRVSSVGEGTPVLLCNGLGCAIESWGPLVESIESCRFVTFDAPGTGDSPCNGAISIDGVAELAAAILDHFDLKRAHVIGYSWGGAVAQQLAWRHPDRVDRLVLAASSVGVGALPGFPLAFAPGSARLLANRVTGRPLPSLAALANQILAFSTWSSLPFLHTIKASTLVLAGTSDRVVPVANARLLAWLLPHAQTALVPGAGHGLFESPALLAVRDLLCAFFDHLPVTTAS